MFVPQSNDTLLLVSFLGGSDAVGSDGIAVVQVDLHAFDRGRVSLAIGSAALSATAYAAEGEIAFASAQGMLAVDGADLVITSQLQSSGSGPGWASEVSLFEVFAIDFGGWELALGETWVSLVAQGQLDEAVVSVEGNVAIVEVDASVEGENSLVDVVFDAFTDSGQYASAIAGVTIGLSGAPSDQDGLFFLTRHRDSIRTGSGEDWVVAGKGNDRVQTSSGHDAVLGQSGDDDVRAGQGDDWVLGGRGHDDLLLGEGADLCLGGDGNDWIDGSSGDDALCGGRGADAIEGGSGDNTFRLGLDWDRSDGSDWMRGGTGADWYWVDGSFGSDRAGRFRVAEGDRIAIGGGNWDDDAWLRDANGRFLTLQRVDNGRDLSVRLTHDDGWSRLLLEDFFVLNREFGSTQRSVVLGDDAAMPLLRAVFLDADRSGETAGRTDPFELGDYLSFLA